MGLVLRGGAHSFLVWLTSPVPHVDRPTAVFAWILCFYLSWVSPSCSSIIDLHFSADGLWRRLFPPSRHFLLLTYCGHGASQPACGLVLTLTASGHVGFRTFSPLIRGLRIGLTPVLGSSVVLRWLSPALSGTLRFGFEDWLSPGGAWIWSAHVWSI